MKVFTEQKVNGNEARKVLLANLRPTNQNICIEYKRFFLSTSQTALIAQQPIPLHNQIQMKSSFSSITIFSYRDALNLVLSLEETTHKNQKIKRQE
ncbi:MAG: hypothetical protein ACJAUP_000202 [Cellvibrionaceae bacterium]|jgi:hypothetical protein